MPLLIVTIVVFQVFIYYNQYIQMFMVNQGGVQ